MKPMDLRSRWVLVTGASAGLGREMARVLAREHRSNLVVVARRGERLEELKRELEAETGVAVAPVVADLAKLEDVDRVFDEATGGRELYAAVLNAGVTHFGPYEELDWDGFERMLSVNVRSVARLMRRFGPYLENQRHGGGMMAVASMAGIVPVSYQTAYSGTKAFLVNYACALHHELEPKNVSVTTFVPGGIDTEMTEGERFGPLRGWLMPVEQAAREGVGAMRARRYLYAPGLSNRLQLAAARFIPQRFLTGRVAATYRDAIRKTDERGR